MIKKKEVVEDQEVVPAKTLLGPKTKYKPQKVQEEDKSCAEVNIQLCILYSGILIIFLAAKQA